MAGSRRPTRVNDLDLEQTAELPVVDLAETVTNLPAIPEPDLGDVTVAVHTLDLDDATSRTDVFEAPRFDIGTAHFSDDLREVEDRLLRKSERLTALENELATLRADHERYVQNAEASKDELARELSALRADAEQRVATLRSESKQALDKVADAHSRELAVQREGGAAELAKLREGNARELANAREVAGRELSALRDATTKELAAARGLHERDRAEARDEKVRGQESITRAHDAQVAAESRAKRAEQQNVDHERELAMRARRIDELQAELARSSGLVRELGEERDTLRASCERQLETLQTAESYRGVIDGMLFEQQSAASAREHEMGALVEQVAQLSQRDARIGQLEGELTALRTQGEQQVKRIGSLTSDAQSWEARLADVNASLAAAERSAQAQGEALRVAAQHAEELQKARALAETTLADERAARDTALAQASAHSQRESVLAEREGALGEREKAANALIDEQRDTVQRLQGAVHAAEERASRIEGDLQAAEEQLRQLEHDRRRHDGRMEDLSRGSEALQTRLGDTERRLEERELRVRRLEAEAHASAAVLGNLNQSIQRMREDTGTHQAIAEPPLESMDRVLIRADGDQSVLHKIGRRTTIGRTPDNDVRVDANFVSRHHAVILASPRTTLIEDLNSTNGVIVNGRRISRQALHDGDRIAIGTAEFRFELRPSGHVAPPA